MNLASDVRRAFLEDGVAPALRERGFRRRGSQWGLKAGGDWAIVHVQFAGERGSPEIAVTYNLGIWSAAVASFLSEPVSGQPPEPECHWRRRAGNLIDEGHDQWWPITRDTGSWSAPLAALGEVVDKEIQHVDHARLRDSWLVESATVVGQARELLYAGILSIELGLLDDAREISRQLWTRAAGSPTWGPAVAKFSALINPTDPSRTIHASALAGNGRPDGLQLDEASGPPSISSTRALNLANARTGFGVTSKAPKARYGRVALAPGNPGLTGRTVWVIEYELEHDQTPSIVGALTWATFLVDAETGAVLAGWSG